MKTLHMCVALLFGGLLLTQPAAAKNKWKLVWSDEFNQEGRLDSTIWNYEEGYARNHEDQWYQPDNAYCTGGNLVIEARKAHRPNPLYVQGSTDWRKKRPYIEYTSSSVNTRGNKEFLYGRIEVRAKIPTASGAWPAIWTLGTDLPWPSNGEIDIMEFYRIDNVPHILANAAWGSDKPFTAVWNSSHTPYSHFTAKDPHWADKFHVWVLDWDKDRLRFYLDGELLNEVDQKKTINGKDAGQGISPFTRKQYILLNLAIGGDHGGIIDDKAMPMKYYVDYVRVYQKK